MIIWAVIGAATESTRILRLGPYVSDLGCKKRAIIETLLRRILVFEWPFAHPCKCRLFGPDFGMRVV